MSDFSWEDKGWICCICGEGFTGYGNNPDPVIGTFDLHTGEEIRDSNGDLLQCCNACNYSEVIPARIKQLEQDLAEDPQPEDPQLQRRDAINKIYDQAERIEALNTEWIEPEQADIEANGWLADQ